MLCCDDCGARFSEARLVREYLGECHGRPAYAEQECCPRCGGAVAAQTGQEKACFFARDMVKYTRNN